MASSKTQIEVSASPASTVGGHTKARVGFVHATSVGLSISLTIGDERQTRVHLEVPMESILEMLPKMLEKRVAFERDQGE